MEHARQEKRDPGSGYRAVAARVESRTHRENVFYHDHALGSRVINAAARSRPADEQAPNSAMSAVARVVIGPVRYQSDGTRRSNTGPSRDDEAVSFFLINSSAGAPWRGPRER